MVKEAREIVRRGELGKLLKVVTEYPQGWLLNPLDAKGQEQAWRNDPEKAGPAGCLGDIGTHVEHLSRYITGLEIDELCADFTTFGAGKRLEVTQTCSFTTKEGRAVSCTVRTFRREKKIA